MAASMNFEELADLHPILNFDPDVDAIINPPRSASLPRKLVLCFFKEVVEKVAAEQKAEIIYTFRSEAGLYPVYAIEFRGEKVAFFQPGVGAPLGVGLMEEAIASGARYLVACGGCGVLNRDIAVGQVLLPTAAYREEGVSYHYLPPSATVEIETAVVDIMETVLIDHEIAYLKTKSWTTDGFIVKHLPKPLVIKPKVVWL